ncbi:FtsX-like permease family protein [Microbispora sp. NPDC049125]|uniref:FtsX-like permease family protein n=1 Tax=Microbispora sp. NPDC049125 TaxID=3154929 RepID=UPI003467E950
MGRFKRGRTPLVVRRALSEPSLLVAAFCSILLAATTLAALTAYTALVTDAGVRRAMETAPLATRATTVTTSVTARGFPGTDRAVRDQIARGYGGVPAPVTASIVSDSYALTGRGHGGQPDLTRFATYEGLGRHAELLTGRWAADGGAEVEAALSQPAADALRLAAGDELTVVSRLDGRPVKVRITGVFRLEDPYGERWTGEELLRSGTQTGDFTTYGPLVVAGPVFLGRFATGVTATWLADPDLRGLSPDRLRTFSASVAGIAPGLRAACPECSVSSRLPGMLTQLDRGALVARSTMLVPVLQLLVLGAYALTLTARLLAEHRRLEIALLRSRGGGTVRLALLAAGEALLIALPSAVAAPFLVPALLGLVGAFPWIGASGVELPRAPGAAAYAVSAAVALACAALLASPALVGAGRTYVEERAARGRGDRPGLVQRAGADVALFVVALLAIWQLRGYGAPVSGRVGGDLGVDPLIVMGPALALLCGGLAVLRLMRVASRVVERITVRRAGFAPAVGARQVSRRPGRYAGPALLLTMAVAMGVLSLTTAATWRASQEDQARHLAGADLRVAAPAGMGGGAQDYAALPGVTAVTPVHRGEVGAGGGVATLLAADAATLAHVMALRPDLSDATLPVLAARLGRTGGAVPVVVTAGLRGDTRMTIGPAVIPVQVVGVVSAMPGTPAGTPAVLAGLDALRAAGQDAAPTEWWLAVDGHDTTRAAAALARRPGVTVTDLAALTRQFRDDPLATGLQGALLLGFAAALAFAVLSFLVNAAVSARERRSEFALLGALGVSLRQMLALLAAEQSFVIGLSLGGGVALAAVLGAVVVPAIVLTGQATAVTPSVLVHIPWAAVTALVLGVLVALLAIVAGLARTLHRRGPAGALRAGEDR